MALTVNTLRSEIDYNAGTGVFTWRLPRRGRARNRVAGCRGPTGYFYICIDGKLYLAHRLAWFYITGSWPSDEIDHRNGIRSDNRWINLRAATRSENGQNVSMRSDNTSGLPGVSWEKRRMKWRAYIYVNARQIFLGFFTDKADAGIAYVRAKNRIHTFNPVARTITTY